VPESRTKFKRTTDAGGDIARPRHRRCSLWISWAQSLMGKYQPMQQQPDSTEMTLVDPFMIIRLMRERWLFATREFKPQINFFITRNRNPRLNPWHWSSRVINLANVWSSDTDRSVSVSLAVGGPHPITAQYDQVRHGIDPATRFESVSHFGAQQHLDLLKNGLLERNSGELITGNRRILEKCQALAQRLELQTRRVEERREEGPMLTIQRISATAERKAPSTRVSVDEPLARAAMDGHPSPLSSMQGQFGNLNNFDQLTDRVIRELDRRVVATRERLGRI
jgi:hypothetical protein